MLHNLNIVFALPHPRKVITCGWFAPFKTRGRKIHFIIDRRVKNHHLNALPSICKTSFDRNGDDQFPPSSVALYSYNVVVPGPVDPRVLEYCDWLTLQAAWLGVGCEMTLQNGTVYIGWLSVSAVPSSFSNELFSNGVFGTILRINKVTSVFPSENCDFQFGIRTVVFDFVWRRVASHSATITNMKNSPQNPNILK